MCLDVIAVIVASVNTVLLGVFAYYIPKKVFINQVFSNLLMEYQSNKLGIAVKCLNDFYKKKCKSKIEMIKNEYIKQYRKDDKQIQVYNNWADTLHFHRRNISQYYQQICQLRFYYILPRLGMKMIQKYFSAEDLKILLILHEIETKAIPEILEKKLTKTVLVKIDKYNELYTESQKWKL